MSTPEGRVKHEVRKLLTAIGAWFYCPVQNGMGVTGIPDFIVCWQGQFIGVECKAPGKEFNVSPNQEKQIDGIQKAGGVAVVVSNVDTLKIMLRLQ